MKEVGFSDENGSILLNNESTSRYLIRKANFETFYGQIANASFVYITHQHESKEVVDSTCGIPCSSELSPENGGKSLTDDCTCVCNSICQRNLIQTENCECVFPSLTNPVFIPTPSLYSQFFVESRILTLNDGEFELVDTPSGCEIIVHSAENETGKIIKILPCQGAQDGHLICSFSVDDSFYIDNTYSATIRCGESERGFNFVVSPARQSNILNTLVAMTKQDSNYVGILVLAIVLLILWGFVK